MTLGQKIRQTRQGQVIPVTEFARRLGVTAAHISDIEHGRRMPNLNLLEEIAKQLKIPIEELRALDGRIDDDLRIQAEKTPAVAVLLRKIINSDNPENLARKFLREADKERKG